MATLEQIFNAVTQLQQSLESAIVSAKLSPKQITIVQGLSEISKSIGSISAGEFLALKSGEDPQDADGIGSFISAMGRVFGTNTYHIGGVYNGDLKWGANAETGELEAGDGAVKLTSNGLSIYNGTTEVARLGNLNGFLSYSTDTYGLALGAASSYMTYDSTNGLRVYGAMVSDREILTADRTYYVRTDGNDSNNGLANTAGGAFLTLQHAIDVIATTLDTRSYNITIQIADGTYSSGERVIIKNLPGTGNLYITGNATTPSSVVISTSITGMSVNGVSNKVYVTGVKFSGENYGIACSGNSLVIIDSVEFGDINFYHLFAYEHGRIYIAGNYTISGGASVHAYAYQYGLIKNSFGALTVTITGTPTFGIYAKASQLGTLILDQFTFSGSATGQRFVVELNSIIGTGGAGVTYFPGDVAGSTASGGLYQ